MKYTPNADNAIDFTIKPDFSQVEADTAQISVNERFALFFPEKRPFFLEGADLFQTPIQAVYTRTITAPDWGARMTGQERGVRYTVLVADDKGGGSVILPGPNGSDLATQDFGSTGRRRARQEGDWPVVPRHAVHEPGRAGVDDRCQQPRDRSGFPVAAVRHRLRVGPVRLQHDTHPGPDGSRGRMERSALERACGRCAVGTQHDAS